jgi:leader peptidase (prepilin peptidase)/N-methyltransferase
VPQQLAIFAYVCLGAFGLIFGSFANVLIWRVPRGESIVSPGSRCPSCGHDIRWYDNVPVLSWLLLRGRCRDCGEPIAWRYPAVELASGALWLLAGWRFGLSWPVPLAVAFFFLLLVLSVIDMEHRRLPTSLIYTLGGAAVVAALFAQVTGLPFSPLTHAASSGVLASPLVASGLGLVLGAGVAWAISAAYGKLRGRQGLGFGDVRLLGAMGLVLGPFVLLAYGLANVFGVVVAVPMMLVGRNRAGEEGATPFGQISFAFGPYLALGGLVTALAGPALWSGYLRLFGGG